MTIRFRPQPHELRTLQSGPLAPYLPEFAALLVRQGYCNESGWDKVRLIADLSRWMAQRNLRPEELNEKRTISFLAAHWKRANGKSGDRCTLTLLLKQLRQDGKIPVPSVPVLGAADLIAQDYERFLRQERSFMSSTVGQYMPVAKRFLHYLFQLKGIRLKQICAKNVIDFVFQDSSCRGRRAAQSMTSVLRSLLNYLFLEGKIAADLSTAVPAIPGWRLSELPRYLESREVEKLLRSCNRRRRTGKRDYAILLLLARLGLRAGEITRLELGDFDWCKGELLIRGKANRVDRLPLLQDVGRALADYLRNARPRCSSRRVFVHCKAPFSCFASPPNAVSGIVRRSLARAGIKSRHQGAHQLRHSLATNMLRDGASLLQIGQVLRHEAVQSTEIYAKVNLNALRTLAQPWPGGVQ
jgi:site-specific recombinase XerD